MNAFLLLLLAALPQGSATLTCGDPGKAGYVSVEVTAFDQNRRIAEKFTVTVAVGENDRADDKASKIADEIQRRTSGHLKAASALGTTVVEGITKDIGRVRLDVQDGTNENEKVAERKDWGQLPDPLDTYQEYGLFLALQGTPLGGKVTFEIEGVVAEAVYSAGTSRSAILSDLARDFWMAGVPALLAPGGSTLYVPNLWHPDGIEEKGMHVQDPGLTGSFTALDNAP